MGVFEIDPICDQRWPEFLDKNARASVFHTPGWLAALRRTYGYRPVAFTTTLPAQPLVNGIVFCRVESWFARRRLVSLPFSDHCQPLVQNCEDAAILSSELVRQIARGRYKWIELRPLDADEGGPGKLNTFGPTGHFCFHTLNLRPSLNALFSNFHPSCIQRKIQRAEREGLAYETGRSEALLAKFYHLLLRTRRRHQLPPQPITWFRNLLDSLGESATLCVAHKDSQPIASMFTLTYKRTVVYKYGCSDARFHNLGGMPWLFWRVIQDARRWGAEGLDLGRSDLDNAGLIAFKDHLGASRSILSYFRHPAPHTPYSNPDRVHWLARRAISLMPDPVLKAAGNLLYRHIG